MVAERYLPQYRFLSRVFKLFQATALLDNLPYTQIYRGTGCLRRFRGITRRVSEGLVGSKC